jgi:predicted Zn-dependent peptidase
LHSKITLKNGVQVVFQKLDGYQSVSIGAFIKTGTMYETREENGISHFIEHMLFKGTKTRTTQEISLTIDRLGGEINAFTSKDCTCFYTKLLSEDIETGLSLLSDMLGESCFNEEAIDTEKSVVIDEINMYEDSAEDVADDLLTALVFKGNALGLPILGDKNSVTSFTKDALIAYFKTHYRPDRMLISIAGEFETEHMLALVERYFGGLQQDSDTRLNEPEAPTLNWGVVSKYKENEQIQVSIDFPGISYEDHRNYEMMLMTNIFGGTNSAMLFQTIREAYGLSYSIYAQPTFYDTVGTLNVSFGVSKENLNEIFMRLAEVIQTLKRDRISAEQVKAGKAHLKGSFLLGLEGTDQYMDLIGRIELFHHKEKDIPEMIAKIEAISEKTIDTLIDLSFGSGECAMSLVGEITTKEAEYLYKKFVKAIQSTL